MLLYFRPSHKSFCESCLKLSDETTNICNTFYKAFWMHDDAWWIFWIFFFFYIYYIIYINTVFQTGVIDLPEKKKQPKKEVFAWDILHSLKLSIFMREWKMYLSNFFDSQFYFFFVWDLAPWWGRFHPEQRQSPPGSLFNSPHVISKYTFCFFHPALELQPSWHISS